MTTSTTHQKQNQIRQKEQLIKQLIQVLDTAGYHVRREKLKQGHGWRAVSGTCRIESNRVVFIDRKLTLDEQMDFLLDYLAASALQLSPQTIESLAPEILQRITRSQQELQTPEAA